MSEFEYLIRASLLLPAVPVAVPIVAAAAAVGPDFVDFGAVAVHLLGFVVVALVAVAVVPVAQQWPDLSLFVTKHCPMVW